MAAHDVTTNRRDRVAVVIPTLNEERYIAGCLADLLAQVTPERGEVLVVDGGSTDATSAIVRSAMAHHPNLRLLPNPKRLQAAAVNLAADQVDPSVTILIRADAHAAYPSDFIDVLVRTLRGTGATSVVVPMVAQGEGLLQRAAAAAQNSVLGNGAAPHRTGRRSGPVEHGHHAAFDLAFFRQIGGYDETFSHNEDAEFDLRAAKAGGLVWLTTEVPITYYPRSDLRRLARQYYAHGRGRGRTILKHRIRPAARQVAPAVVLTACGTAALTAFVWPAALALPLSYVAAATGYGALHALRQRRADATLMGPAAVVMHMSWGAGFLSHMASHAASAVRDRWRPKVSAGHDQKVGAQPPARG